jgi:hypothetical protein
MPGFLLHKWRFIMDLCLHGLILKNLGNRRLLPAKKSQNKNSAIARKSAFIRYVLPQRGKEEGPTQIVDASLM